MLRTGRAEVRRSGHVLARLAPGDLFGEEALIKICLRNVVDNALRYSPGGAPVSIRLFSENGSAILEVEDSGPGIPPEGTVRPGEKGHYGTDLPEGEPIRAGIKVEADDIPPIVDDLALIAYIDFAGEDRVGCAVVLRGAERFVPRVPGIEIEKTEE